jgi:hypothetical protein
MFATQSKGIEGSLLIARDLPWSSNLKQRVPMLEIDRIVRMYSLEINDVFEVPADKDIHPSHGSQSDVQGIHPHSAANRTVLASNTTRHALTS